MGSPPPKGSKNLVLKFRSVKSIVMPPAKTGKDKSKSTAVIKTAQINKGNSSDLVRRERVLKIVLIKLIAPKMEETPARCKEKIVKSTEGPPWPPFLLDKGG